MKFLLFKSGGLNEILLIFSSRINIYYNKTYEERKQARGKKNETIADEENYLWKWFKAIFSDFSTLLQITKWSVSLGF